MRDLLRKLLFLPPEASTVAGGLDTLHYFLAIVTMLGAVGVIAAGTYFIVRYRRRTRMRIVGTPTRGDLAPDERGIGSPPAEESHRGVPLSLELGIVFGLLSLFVLWWFIGFRQYVQMRMPPANAMEVYVTAKKWMWQFDYPEGPRTMTTLVVPADRPIKLLMTSRDVIHSFYVPSFRVKQDVLPGRYTTIWFEPNAPGRYPILCTEYCGTGHSTMRGEVLVLAPDEFERWLSGQADLAPGVEPLVQPAGTEQPGAAPIQLAKVGAKVAADRGCLRCHTVDGTPHLGPTWAHLYGTTVPLEGGGEASADAAYLTESMMDPNLRLRRGFPAIMPTYQGLLAPQDTAAIVEYIKSLRDLPAGPRVPEDPGAAAKAAASQPASPAQVPVRPAAEPPSSPPAPGSPASPAAPGGGRP